MRTTLLFAFWLVASCVSAQEVDFETQVAPILKKHCSSCHNDDEAEGNFNVDSFASIMEGAADLHIVNLMRGTEEPAMPPEDDFDRVPEKEIAIIESWIAQGAKKSATPAAASLSITTPKWNTNEKCDPAILSADWSPDGKTIAIAKFQAVELLDSKTLKLKHRFDTLPGKVNSVQFSSNGKKLIAASGIGGVGGQATIWDAGDYTTIVKLEGHSDVMYDAVISPDGSLAATSAYDKTILLWDLQSGKQLRKLKGHNSAVYDLDFSPDSKNLLSASGDQTIKVWKVETGERLDTLGQPLKEQFSVMASPDGNMVVGGGRDNRLRVWKLTSVDSPAINPILFSRFAHEASIVRVAFSRDGSRLFSSAEDKTIRIWETESFLQVGLIDKQREVCSAIVVSPDAKEIFVGRIDGSMELLGVPAETRAVAAADATKAIEVHRDTMENPGATPESEPNDVPENVQRVTVPALVNGTIVNRDATADADLYRFTATAGQSLMIETRAQRDKSPLDSRIEILHADGTPVPQVLLRAVRDSYFTFRGKDSDTSDDFRLHNWQEMKLNEFLYSNGEVNKLFLRPRGPDSGFRVYPGEGKRFGYFGTTPMSHALQEPCYIVEPWPPGTTFLPNGLPVFEINYENDDDSRRELGKDSRLKFVAPADGEFLVRVTDVRGFGGEDYKYQLTIRDSNPDFGLGVKGPKSIFPKSGSEFRVIAKRKDGYEGPIHIEIQNLPEGYRATSPLTIEANHVETIGAVYALEGAASLTEEQAKAITIVGVANIAGQEVTRTLAGVSEVKIEELEPKVEFQIVRGEGDELPESRNFDQPLVFEIRPGETIKLHVVAKRNSHEGPITFGKEGSGRNLPHGVKVADIGLNGLMIPRGHTRQRFFIKCDTFVKPQTRTFHLKSDNLNNVVCPPVVLKVLPVEEKQLTGQFR